MSKKPTDAGRDKWKLAAEKAQRSIDAMTDEEDAEIHAAALSDPDAQPLTEDWFRNARPFTEEEIARYRGMRGPQRAPTKKPTSIRLDADVVEHFKAGGPGWQSRINQALRKVAGLG
jgi:uncharacterized protein (DUF4415 family)